MRSLRLALYFVLGLMLGGVTVTAFAATGPSRYGSSVNFNYPNGLNIRHPRSGPIYDFDSAPDGWGHMRDINKMSIGGRDVDINGLRKFAPGNLAKLGVGLAKSLGPIGIGLTLADLIWDEVSQQWLKEPENPLEYPSHRWTVQGCNGPSCQPNFATYQEAGHFACTQYYGSSGVKTWTQDWGNPPVMYYSCWGGGRGCLESLSSLSRWADVAG